ncbi:homoprotocatechuate degradation operon regulator HpaR [Comamonas sp. w2-DMI]|uniref:Homoprotocatechuate degradation operon regulator HpaR n=1 Tax=Comamonas terrae TaxID=673548 RepID=A0ABW5UK77_9BURK|nr:homoprotocatechuate degradation operon regulator HpaR [Comamonas terrae]
MTEPRTTAATEPLRSFARSLPMALLKARESVMVRFRPLLRAHGLTEQQWRVLRALSASDHRLRPMELSQMTFISMPSLSRLLKTLEGRELIKRGRHVGDLRGAEFGLTEAARAIVTEIGPDSEEIYAEIERIVGNAEIQQLYLVLEQVVQRLGAPDAIDAD